MTSPDEERPAGDQATRGNTTSARDPTHRRGEKQPASADPVQQLLARLPGHKRAGDGWSARCPAHEDHNPSLSVTRGDDGRALVTCHAGCEFKDIVAALGLEMRDLFAPKNNGRGRTIAAEYDYTDESGNLLFQTVRYSPKAFAQRRPDGPGRRVWNLKGVRRVLYQLPTLLAANPSEPVFIVEGEKDVHTLNDIGLVATTNPMGAGKWRREYAASLAGRSVVVVPDLDGPGFKHTAQVIASLEAAGIEWRLLILELGNPAIKDVTDWLAAGHTREELLRRLEETKPRTNVGPEALKSLLDIPGPDRPGRVDAGRPPTKFDVPQAQALVELAADCDLFHSPGLLAFASIPVGKHRETHAIRSRGFRLWLSRAFYESFDRPPAAQALADAVGLLEGKALFDGPERAVHVRVAENNDNVYVDLADAEWRAIEVTPCGWRVVSEPPVMFTRPRGLLALPVPASGGRVDELRPFLNLDDDGDFALLVCWLAAALRPTGPYPVLVLNGEQGSAKSTVCRVVKALLDPNVAPLRAEPREVRDLMIAASNGWCCAFDNISSLHNWMSDAICRLATGGGFSTRELYTDDEEKLFDAMRPVALNGIEEVVSRGDLLDRAIALTLPPIPDEERRPEKDFWRDFEAARPRILGALLDAVAAGLRNLPTVKLSSLPRMADFALWSVACEGALNLPPGLFLDAYADKRAAAVELALEASPVGPSLLGLMHDSSRWEGTAGDLLAELSSERRSDERTRKRWDWPKTPRAMRGALNRLAPDLRKLGIEVTFARGGRRGARTIVLERATERPTAASAHPGVGTDSRGRADGSPDGADGSAAVPSAYRQQENRVLGPENGVADGTDGADGSAPALSTADREVFEV